MSELNKITENFEDLTPILKKDENEIFSYYNKNFEFLFLFYQNKIKKIKVFKKEKEPIFIFEVEENLIFKTKTNSGKVSLSFLELLFEEIENDNDVSYNIVLKYIRIFNEACDFMENEKFKIIKEGKICISSLKDFVELISLYKDERDIILLNDEEIKIKYANFEKNNLFLRFEPVKNENDFFIIISENQVIKIKFNSKIYFYKDEKWHKEEDANFVCNDEEMFELILFEILGKSSSKNNIFRKVMDDYVDTLSKVELDLNKRDDIIAPV